MDRNAINALTFAECNAALRLAAANERGITDEARPDFIASVNAITERRRALIAAATLPLTQRKEA